MMKMLLQTLTLLLSLMLLPLSVQAEWVYIGEYGANGPLSSGFRVDALPAAGETLYANQGMNLRDAAPHLRDGEWRLGEVTGVLHRGEGFTVEALSPSRAGAVPGDVWARGSVQR
jgi:hypothetical protein